LTYQDILEKTTNARNQVEALKSEVKRKQETCEEMRQKCADKLKRANDSWEATFEERLAVIKEDFDEKLAE